MQKLAVVIHTPPFRNAHGQSALDFLLAASVLKVKISLIFMGLGISQIINKTPDLPILKDYTKGFAALPLYDVNDIYLQSDALKRYQFNQTALSVKAIGLSDDQIQQLLAQQDKVVYF